MEILNYTHLIDYMFRPNSRPAAGLIQERVPRVLESCVFKGRDFSFYALTPPLPPQYFFLPKKSLFLATDLLKRGK